MNIVTCFKVVPEEQDITIQSNGDISFDKAKLTVSNYDLNSIEAGVQLVEANGGSLTALSAGTTKINDSKLKKNVLSRGPESLYLVADDSLDNMDTHQTAQVLKAGIEKIGSYDLILCGEGSADLYAQQVGAQLGQLLNVPTINSISNISVVDGKVTVERTLEDEVETLEVPLPAVISVTADINMPRIPSMKQILGAGKKPSTVLTAEDVSSAKLENSIEVLETKAPEQVERKQDIIEGDSDDAIKQFVEKIAVELK
ncbi:electron transfer flavoprotein [Bacillus sp. B15-48]|uniref:electron transfer flavoprotein n=1 Tax=Bacillus sp. B15-48 TaxID=1548601 RepID=UPI00193FE690|nr:electron transfer flavoprotein [Bacillus sp. B15-48]MBM4764580.1 electron transfer flavoprotein [Bacillus sp. B15-48]